MAAVGKPKPIRASLPYEFLLYFNAWYFCLFFLVEIGVFIWKGVILPYPTANYAAEFVLVFIIAAIVVLQIRSGRKGNLTERSMSTFISFLLTLPVIAGFLYLLLWQTYVLMIELVMICIEFVFVGLEIIFGIICIITFVRAT